MSDNEKCQNDPFAEFGPLTHIEVIQKYPQEVWDMVKRQQAELKTLQDKIAELEVDRMRIDWLEMWSPRIYFNAAGNWAIERTGEEIVSGVTLSAAIDKARK